MPFMEKLGEDVWIEKREVGLRQLEPRGIKTYFKVLETFGYVTRGEYNPYNSRPQEGWTVTKNSETDLASIPQFLWGLIGSYGGHTMPALLHDHLCNSAKRERKQGGSGVGLRTRRYADKLFRRMLRDDARAGIVTRWIMWAAVRLFASIPFGLATIGSTALLTLLLWGFDGTLIRWVAAAIGITYILLLVGLSFEAVNGNRNFRPLAFMSLFGASIIGAAAFYPLLPVAGVTIVTWVALRFLDFIAWGLHTVFVRLPIRMLERIWAWRAGILRGVHRGLRPEASARLEQIADEPKPAMGVPFPRL